MVVIWNANGIYHSIAVRVSLSPLSSSIVCHFLWINQNRQFHIRQINTSFIMICEKLLNCGLDTMKK